MGKNAFCPCGKYDAGRCLCPPANDNDRDLAGPHIIFWPSDAQLKKPWVPHRLAIAYRELVPISRYAIPDWLCHHIWGFQGLLIGPDGQSIDPLTIDIDEEINTDGDGGIRWYSDLLQNWHDQMPLIAPHPSQLRRFRMLFLGLAVIAPSTASKIL